MTKALCVADIHLNLNKNKEWEEKRFSSLFDYLKEADEGIIFLLGDIFDKARPSLEEIGLFYSNIAKLHNKQVRVIAGNHEILAKDVTVFDKLPQVGYKYYRDFDIIKIENVNIYLCGHNKLYKLQETKRGSLSSKVNILMTHVRCNIPPHIKEEIPLQNVSDIFDYIIAGDIHSLYKPFDNFYYTNQPYSTTYSKDKAHHIIRLSIDRSDVQVQHIPVNFPNKVLKVLDDNKIPHLNKKDLFKVRVTGSLKDLMRFENKGNIIYDKTVESIVDTDIKRVNQEKRIDLQEHIVALMQDTVDEESLRFGTDYIKEILEE